MPDRLAVAREPRRPVRQVALVLLLADREAEIRAVVEAVDALAALRREERHDVVARRDRGDAVADRLDDAGALVAEHRRRVPRRVGAGGGVQVGVADAARGEPDEHLARLRLGELELLDLERRAELLENRGLDVHAAIIVESWPTIRPFRALRYAVPDLAGVVAPPYDVISRRAARRVPRAGARTTSSI